jgi:hypothetical protein
VFADVGLSVHYAAEGLYSSDVKQTTLSTTFLSAGMLLVYIGVIFIPS